VLLLSCSDSGPLEVRPFAALRVTGAAGVILSEAKNPGERSEGMGYQILGLVTPNFSVRLVLLEAGADGDDVGLTSVLTRALGPVGGASGR
jgi:hypothetical protein